jgi:hypothetical protein
MGILVPTLYQEDFALESLLGSKLQICCLRKCDRTGANEDKDKDKDRQAGTSAMEIQRLLPLGESLHIRVLCVGDSFSLVSPSAHFSLMGFNAARARAQ